MAGIVVLVVTWLVEGGLMVTHSDDDLRHAAVQRFRWLTGLGVALFAVTLLNPYGWNLYLGNLQVITDPFIQSNTTQEWQSPDFAAPGWFRVELLILLLPVLATLSRRRISLLALAMMVVWLHFALTSRRYSPIWCVVAVPHDGDNEYSNSMVSELGGKAQEPSVR